MPNLKQVVVLSVSCLRVSSTITDHRHNAVSDECLKQKFDVEGVHSIAGISDWFDRVQTTARGSQKPRRSLTISDLGFLIS